jgi:hypothetical protein
MKALFAFAISCCLLGVLAIALATRGTAAPPPAAATDEPKASWTAQLERIADVVTVIMDGDDCRSIVTERAEDWMHRKNLRGRFDASDNYDVHFEPFRRNKKLLIRLGMLADFPVSCTLWLRSRKQPDKIHCVIRQKQDWSRYYRFGTLLQDVRQEMRPVLDDGRRVTLSNGRRDLCTVLTPVKDSLGDVVGFVEVCARPPGAEGRRSSP